MSVNGKNVQKTTTYGTAELQHKKGPKSPLLRREDDSAIGDSVSPSSSVGADSPTSETVLLVDKFVRGPKRDLMRPIPRPDLAKDEIKKTLLDLEPARDLDPEGFLKERAEKAALRVIEGDEILPAPVNSTTQTSASGLFATTSFGIQSNEPLEERHSKEHYVEKALHHFEKVDTAYDLFEKAVELTDRAYEMTEVPIAVTKDLTEFLGLAFAPLQVIANSAEVVLEAKGAAQDFALGQTSSASLKALHALKSAVAGSSAGATFTNCVEVALEGFDNYVHVLESAATSSTITFSASCLGVAAGAMGLGLETYKFAKVKSALSDFEKKMSSHFPQEMKLTDAFNSLMADFFIHPDEAKAIQDKFPQTIEGIEKATKKIKKLKASKLAQFEKLVGKNVAKEIYTPLSVIYGKILFASQNPDHSESVQAAFQELPPLMTKLKHGLEKELLLHKLRMVAYSVIVAGGAASFATGPAGVAAVIAGILGLIAIFIADKKLSAEQMVQKIKKVTQKRPLLAKLIGEKFPDLLIEKDFHSKVEIDDEDLACDLPYQVGNVYTFLTDAEIDDEPFSGGALIQSFSGPFDDFGALDPLNFDENYFS